MSELTDYAKTIISKHGIHGDKSFEYLGVNIDSKMTFKTYRKISEDANQYLANTEPYCSVLGSLPPDFLSQNKLTICDFSKGALGNIETFRIVFILDSNLNIHQTEKCVADFLMHIGGGVYLSEIVKTVADIQKVLKTDKAMLMQLGIEVDEKSCLLGIKYYVGIKNNGIITSIDMVMELLSRIIGDLHNRNEFRSAIEFLVQQEFEPIFIGVNLYGDTKEVKLYFISKAFGFQTKKVIKHTLEVMREYHLDYFISEKDVNDLYEMDLFVRGIAIDISDKNKWRLYINALPRKTV